MGTKGCAKVKPSCFLLPMYYHRGKPRDCCFLPAPEPSWAGWLRDACTILGLDLKDQGDKLLLALEQVGVGKKIKSETHGKHLLLEISFSKREGEAAVLHAGDHQDCAEKQEGRGGRASDKASAKSERHREDPDLQLCGWDTSLDWKWKFGVSLGKCTTFNLDPAQGKEQSALDLCWKQHRWSTCRIIYQKCCALHGGGDTTL